MELESTQRREAMLREMGLVRMASPSGGEDRIVAAASPHSMEGGLGVLDDDDQEVVACMVCREGYTQQPQSMLALYCFSRRIRVRTAPPPPSLSTAAAAVGGGIGGIGGGGHSSMLSTPRTPSSPLPPPPTSPGSSSAAAAAGMMTASASALLSPGSVGAGGGGGGSGVGAPSPRTPTDRQLRDSSVPVSTQLAYSTVSHFNAIHLSCHQVPHLSPPFPNPTLTLSQPQP